MRREGWLSMKAQICVRRAEALHDPRPYAMLWNRQFPSPGCRTTLAVLGASGLEGSGANPASDFAGGFVEAVPDSAVLLAVVEAAVEEAVIDFDEDEEARGRQKARWAAWI
mmetsp:Transcript_12309/g.18659  ORF Transcript_12309/g.18659 Transcript_12309/m.18659 type:complete len:111 (+) Transcript_12309:551-883(+)